MATKAKMKVKSAAAGKVPKAKQDLVVALADSFALGETIELSDGTAKMQKSQSDVLTEILRSIPLAVSPGKLDLSDGGDEGKPLDLSKIKGKI